MLRDPARQSHPELADELERTRLLLGQARRALDRLAAAALPDARTAALVAAADVSQRIVDEIGNPHTGEPALAGTYRDILADIAARAGNPHDPRNTTPDPQTRLHAITSICQAALNLGQ